jgi:hypothetical protein
MNDSAICALQHIIGWVSSYLAVDPNSINTTMLATFSLLPCTSNADLVLINYFRLRRFTLFDHSFKVALVLR